jgi:dihydrolipoamide dehydrogenase
LFILEKKTRLRCHIHLKPNFKEIFIMKDISLQVVVIGAGPGGYSAAFMAADLGLTVALIDSNVNPGGVCLYHGCIPSKTLLHTARVIHETKAAEAFGIGFEGLKVDQKKIRKWKQGVVEQMTAGLGQLTKRKKIQYIQGRASFQNNHQLKVTESDGKKRLITFEYAIIATGSQPIRPKSLDIDSVDIWDSASALELKTIPRRLLVIGGGYIGLELGTVYAALGSCVEVVETTAGLLPGVDRDLVRYLRKSVADRFAAVHLNTTVTHLLVKKNGIEVTMEGSHIDDENSLFDKVLVAVGRRPNTKNIGLENTGIELTDKGFIRVDSKLRTAESHIFAVGDVAGDPMLAHKATHEGRIAAEVIAQHEVAFEPACIPAVVFTDPEIAWVGLNEIEAQKRDLKIKVIRFPWAASGRAATMARKDGQTKLLVDPKTERILGMGIVGPNAGEMISEGALAIEMGANVTDISSTIHPHPTLSETIMEAAEVFLGTATHYHRA